MLRISDTLPITHWFTRDDVDSQQIVSRHIKLLHRYNEAKDATQVPLVLANWSLMLTLGPFR